MNTVDSSKHKNFPEFKAIIDIAMYFSEDIEFIRDRRTQNTESYV